MKYLDDQQTTTVSTSMEEKNTLEITTETDVLSIPLFAKITTIDEFNKLYGGILEAGINKRIRILGLNQTKKPKPVVDMFPNVLTGLKA